MYGINEMRQCNGSASTECFREQIMMSTGAKIKNAM